MEEVESQGPLLRQMVEQAIDALGGETTRAGLIAWILEHFPDANPGSVHATTSLCTVNLKTRLHYPENQRARAERPVPGAGLRAQLGCKEAVLVYRLGSLPIVHTSAASRFGRSASSWTRT